LSKRYSAIVIPTIKFVPKQSFHYLNIKRDEHGYTHPNLHRRIDPHTIHDDKDHMELKPRQYTIGVLGTNSYRTTEMFTHDEDSETSEVP